MTHRCIGATPAIAVAGFLLFVVVADGALTGVATTFGLGSPTVGASPTPVPVPSHQRPQRSHRRLYVYAADGCLGLGSNVVIAIGKRWRTGGTAPNPGQSVCQQGSQAR